MNGKDWAYIGLAGVAAYAAYTLFIKPAQQVESAVGQAAQGAGTTLYNLTPMGQNDAAYNLGKDFVTSLNSFLNNQAGNGSNVPSVPSPTTVPALIAQNTPAGLGGPAQFDSGGLVGSAFNANTYNPTIQAYNTATTAGRAPAPYAVASPTVTQLKAPTTTFTVVSKPTNSIANWAVPTFTK